MIGLSVVFGEIHEFGTCPVWQPRLDRTLPSSTSAHSAAESLSCLQSQPSLLPAYRERSPTCFWGLRCVFVPLRCHMKHHLIWSSLRTMEANKMYIGFLTLHRFEVKMPLFKWAKGIPPVDLLMIPICQWAPSEQFSSRLGKCWSLPAQTSHSPEWQARGHMGISNTGRPRPQPQKMKKIKLNPQQKPRQTNFQKRWYRSSCSGARAKDKGMPKTRMSKASLNTYLFCLVKTTLAAKKLAKAREFK